MEKTTSFQYSDDELRRLHDTLYELLGEVARVCDRHGIAYFIIGGTAIGAHFWQGIIPWDDDIDIGMTRDNYERFLAIAPDALRPAYFLQWQATDPHVPFYFAKVRKNDTLFCENQFKDIRMHQGIYVDIFPFDKVPDSPRKERLQHRLFNFFNGSLIAKEIWQYNKLGKCQADTPRHIGWPGAVVFRLMSLLPKTLLFRLTRRVQTWYNNKPYTRCKNIATRSEWLFIDEAEHPRTVTLGPLRVTAPADLQAYLLHHYTHIEKHVPQAQRINHRPAALHF